MILSDLGIIAAQQEELLIDPYDENCLEAASYDVHLGNVFQRMKRYMTIDIKEPVDDIFREEVYVPGEAVLVQPGDLLLGSLVERITLPTNMAAQVAGKSSLGRLGLQVHATAGFVDPGWDGHLTLEINNVSTARIYIYPGMKIGQICFYQLDTDAMHPYQGKYQGATGPQVSQYWKNMVKSKPKLMVVK